MGYETDNPRQSTLTDEKEAQQDMLASLLDPAVGFPVRITAATLTLAGVADLLIETAGNIRLIPTDEIAEVEVDRRSDRLMVTHREMPVDPNALPTSTFSLKHSTREWLYQEDIPTLSFPPQTLYNTPIPGTGVWKVTSSIATRGEIVYH